MKMSNIVIFGTGTLAKLMHHLIETTTHDSVICFAVNDNYKHQNMFEGKPVYSYESIGAEGFTENALFLCAIGYSNMRARKSIFERLKSDGRKFYNYISPHALLDETVTLGENNIIFHNANIEPFCAIGNNNIIWSSALICHDVECGDHNFFAANVTIGGFCKVKNLCFFGFSSTIIDNLEVSDETLVGATSLLLTSTSPSTKYIGNPATVTGTHFREGITI